MDYTRILWSWLDKAVAEGKNRFKGQKSNSLNQKLFNEVQQCFENNLVRLSVGERMLYPMSFTILMHQNDYNEMENYLGFVLAEVVANNYRIMDKYSTLFPNFKNPAQYWFFNISGSKLSRIPIGDGQYLDIRRGMFTLIAHLFAANYDQQNNVTTTHDLRVSVRIKNSHVYSDVNLNPDVLNEFEILAPGVFKFPFDKSLPKDSNKILEGSNVSEINGLAVLSYAKEGSIVYFTMRDRLIHISGRNEKRKGPYFILESDNIIDSHVQIKYIPSEKKFQLAAFGPTRCNSKNIELSSGGNVKWTDLSNNSSIFINEEIKVRFEIK